jgi:DNA-binding transcriptional MerR regulator
MAGVTYDMDELERKSGVGARTIRNWIGRRLLPRARGAGRAARYDERHLLRVCAIKALRDQDVDLASIRKRISDLDDAGLQALVTSRTRPALPTTPPAPPVEPTFPVAHMEIVELMDGLVLMIDPSKGKVLRRVAADIYQHYSHRQ